MHLYQEGQVWRNRLRQEQWFLVLDTEGEHVKISMNSKQIKRLHYRMLGNCYELLKEAE